MIIHNIPQHLEDGSTNPEWKALRVGKPTASRMADLMATIKTGEAAARRDYKFQILAEQLTGEPQDSGFVNDEMRWGIANEGSARDRYEVEKGVFVDQCAFATHATLAAGASPDGLIGEDGILEIKCPKTSTHVGYLMDGTFPSKYRYQVQWQLACTDRQWCDFVSYDPRLPEDLQFFCIRVNRDNEFIQWLEAEVQKFLAEVADMLSALHARKAA